MTHSIHIPGARSLPPTPGHYLLSPEVIIAFILLMAALGVVLTHLLRLRRYRIAIAEGGVPSEEALAATNQAVVVIDSATGRATYVSPAFENLWGVSPRFLFDGFERLVETIHPDDRERWLAFHRELESHPGSSREIEYRMIRADGQTRWILGRWVKKADSPSRAAHRIGLWQDVTDVVRAREALRASETRYRRLFHASAAMYAVLDPETGAILDANQATADFYGYPIETVLRMNAAEVNVVPPEEVLKRLKDLVKAPPGRYEVVHKLAGGETRDMELYVNPVEVSGKTLLFYVIHDITERKRALAALRDSEARLRLTLEGGQLATWDWNILTNEAMWDDEHAGLQAFASGRFRGSADELARVIHPDDHGVVVADTERARRTGGLFLTQYRQVARDGTIRWVVSRGRFIFDQAGNPVRMLGIAADVSDRVRAELLSVFQSDVLQSLVEAVPLDRVLQKIAESAQRLIAMAAPIDRADGHARAREVPPARVSIALPGTPSHHFVDEPDTPADASLAAFIRTMPGRNGEPLGKVKLEYATPHRPDPWDIEVLESAARLAGLAVQRRAAETALAESRAHLGAIVRSVPIGIMSFDRDFRMRDINPAALRIFGFSTEELIGQKPWMFIPPKERAYVSEIWNKLLSNTGGMRGTNTNVTKDGREISCEWYNATLTDADGNVTGAVCAVEDVTNRLIAERWQKRLVEELNHRVKNNLAAIDSLARQTRSASGNLDEFLQAFLGRVRALARTHSALAESRWQGASLRAIATQSLSPFSHARGACELEGEDVTLSPKQAQAVALTLHELGTNAAKYGAFLAPTGAVTLRWHIEMPPADAAKRADPVLHMLWTERGGPPVAPPESSGVGSGLIKGMIEHELAGFAEFFFEPGGLRCVLRIPLSPEKDDLAQAARELESRRSI